jgi:hypothetical protein
MAPPETVFYNVIKFGKFALLAALLTMSFTNGHKEYINENPRKFLWDCLAVGGTSALAISIVAWMRSQTFRIPTVAFIAFFLFFVYNVVREISGFNAAAGGDAEDLTLRAQAQWDLLSKPVTVFIAGVAGFMTVLALFAHIPHPQGMFALVKESFIVAGMTALGEAVIAYNHGHAITRPALLNFIAFFIGNMIMQFGGFYDQVFPPPAIIRM